MASTHRRVLVTGAYGYLGSRIRAALDAAGWETHALVRSPRADDDASPWRLGVPPSVDLSRFDALVHCAYDFSLRRRSELWQTNVVGSATLLDAASRGGVGRIVVLSSMSAYPGTRQLYGNAKLAIEESTLALGGIVVRPGLVYGSEPGGMVGTMLRLSRLPLVPLIGAGSRQFPVLDSDLADTVVAILERPSWISEVIGVAQAEPMRFRDVVETLMHRNGGGGRLIELPSQPVYWALRAAEAIGLRFPFRADSVIGLTRPAPAVPRSRAFPDIPDRVQVLTHQR